MGRIRIVISILMFTTASSYGQALSFEQFIWENRLVILYDDAVDTKTIQQQLAIFQNQESELTDRKLIIIASTPDGAYYLFKDGQLQSTAISNTEHLNINGTGFNFNLIGLDGGIKHRSQTIVSAKALFSMIDGMPMRRSELRDRKKD